MFLIPCDNLRSLAFAGDLPFSNYLLQESIPMTTLIDPLTKRTYEYEFRNYTQYWGLSKEQATAVMECTTYESRRLVLEAFRTARLANSRYR